MRAFIGLGSNLGDREAYLRTAIEGLPDVVAVSPIYETEPVGGPADQPPYLNCVVELDTDLTPRQLLEIGQRLEQEADRVRAERWGPRTLDVDILLVGDVKVDEPDLVVPHPRMWERDFVLRPLADLTVKKTYDAIADRYTAEAAADAARVGRAQPLLDLPSGSRILDLGCGAGVPVTKALAGRGHYVTGVDRSTHQIALARSNVPSGTFIEGDMTAVEFEEGSFDGVWSSYAFIHVPRHEQPPLFERIARWLRPNGLLVASFGVSDWPGDVEDFYGEPTFFSHFDAATNQRLVRSAGFTIEVGEVVEAPGERHLWLVATKTQ